jgi:hypothetical protein
LTPRRESSVSENENDKQEEMEEGFDSVPSLGGYVPSPSPRRTVFRAGPNPIQALDAPTSPSWQSMTSPNPNFNYNFPNASGSGSPSPPGISSARFRQALDVPPSPLGAGAGGRRFDPTPQHGIHARNLSLYFPQPGQKEGAVVLSPEMIAERRMSVGSGIPTGERNVFGGSGDWSFGKGPKGDGEGLQTPDAKRGKRRGHHVSCRMLS